jgi:hypothetical protein
LKSVVISEGFTDIGLEAFKDCTSLDSVTIPDTITSIGALAFEDTPWQERQGDFVIVNGILIRYQGSDTSVEIPVEVTSIGDGAFQYFKDLENVVIPTSVITIGEWAFDGCTHLESITTPASVISIGRRAFSYCASLESITILNPNCVIDSSSKLIWGGGNLTIYGYANSTAEAFAKQEGHNFVALASVELGNVNGDGDTDLNDVEALFQYISGQGGEVNTAAADVNGDDVIDLKDVTRLYQFLSGQISSLD